MLPLLALGLLAACGRQHSSADHADDRAASQPAPVAVSAPKASPDVPGTALPPADAKLRYIGRWAARLDLCRAGAWRFTARRLSTAGEVSCDFDHVGPIPGGYAIDATCTAEAPPVKDHFTLRFAESARAMLVAGSKVLADTGLIWCGPDQAAPEDQPTISPGLKK